MVKEAIPNGYNRKTVINSIHPMDQTESGSREYYKAPGAAVTEGFLHARRNRHTGFTHGFQSASGEYQLTAIFTRFVHMNIPPFKMSLRLDVSRKRLCLRNGD